MILLIIINHLSAENKIIMTLVNNTFSFKSMLLKPATTAII